MVTFLSVTAGPSVLYQKNNRSFPSCNEIKKKYIQFAKKTQKAFTISEMTKYFSRKDLELFVEVSGRQDVTALQPRFTARRQRFWPRRSSRVPRVRRGAERRDNAPSVLYVTLRYLLVSFLYRFAEVLWHSQSVTGPVIFGGVGAQGLGHVPPEGQGKSLLALPAVPW